MTLTINKLLWYTNRFAVILFTLGVIVGCGGEPVECDDKGDCTEMHKNLLKSQLSEMRRTRAAGSAATDLPTGSPIPNIQIDHLDPGLYTVQFEVLPPDDGNGFSAYAIVNWKVDGQPITRKLSVFSGASISGVAEAVDIKIVDYSDTASGALSAAPYKVGASLSRGQRADIMQPPSLTTNPRAIPVGAGLSTTFVVPQGAGVTSVMVLTATQLSVTANANPLGVTAHGADNALGVTTQSWYPILQGPGWVPLTPRTTSIIVQNFDVNDVDVQVLWGIEG